jgi:hypothetical protein
MPRSVLPAEDCVFRLDYRDGYRQAFPMTFNKVGLSDDGFEFDGESSYIKIGTELHLNDFTIIINVKNNKTEYTTHINDYLPITSSSGNEYDNYICVRALTDGLEEFYVEDSSGTGASSGHSYRNTLFNEYVFCVNDGVASFYINGETYTVETDLLAGFDIKYIGLGYASSLLNGTVKHVSIYDRALTPTQVKHISTQMMRKIGRQ